MTFGRAIILSSVIISEAFFCHYALCAIRHEETDSILTTTLDKVEIRHSKNYDRIRSSAPTFNLDANQIKLLGVTDISDALHRLPGVNLRDYGGAGGMKTLSVRGLGASHTGVIYDGIPLSDIQGAQIDLSRYSLENLQSLSLNLTDNARIWQPARAFASASSLTIESKMNVDSETDGLSGRARITGGAFGMISPSADLLWKKRGFAIGFAGQYMHSDNNYTYKVAADGTDKTYHRNNSQLNSTRLELNTRYRINTNHNVRAQFYHYDNHSRLPGAVVVYNPVSRQKLISHNSFAQLYYRGKFSEIISMKAYAKYNHAYSNYTDRDGIYPGGFLDQRYHQNEIYLTAAMLLTPGKGFSLNYSADWFRNMFRSNLPTNISPRRDAILQTLAIRYRLKRLDMMARGLWSIYLNSAKYGDAGADYSHLSPSVSISWQVLAEESLFVRTSYKEIFRMPSFSELYFDHLGSVNLKPENTRQLNAGITWLHRNLGSLTNIEITADCYYNKVTNKIVAVPYNMFLNTMTNLGKVRILGSDITLAAEICLSSTQSFLIRGNYSYMRAAPRTNRNMADWMKQVAYTPLNSGSASVSWLNPWISAGLHGSGVSARYATNTNISSTRIPGYWECGLSAWHDFHIRKCLLTLRGDITNILNRQYKIVARYPMPRRGWSLSVSADF